MRATEVYECWVCGALLVIDELCECCPDCGAEFAIEWRAAKDSGGATAEKKKEKQKAMKNSYAIQNYRINLAVISHVAIGEETLKVIGPGTDITLDKATPEASDFLDVLALSGWVHANGNLINPELIVYLAVNDDGYLHINAGGTIIWVPDEEQMAKIQGLFLRQSAEPTVAAEAA